MLSKNNVDKYRSWKAIKNDNQETLIDSTEMSSESDTADTHVVADYVAQDVKTSNQPTLHMRSATEKSSPLDMEPREYEPPEEYDFGKYGPNQAQTDQTELIFAFGNLESLIVLSTAVLFTFCLSLNAPTSTYPAIAAIQIVIYDFFKH